MSFCVISMMLNTGEKESVKKNNNNMCSLKIVIEFLDILQIECY